MPRLTDDVIYPIITSLDAADEFVVLDGGSTVKKVGAGDVARFATHLAMARDPDQLIVGAITRDANGAATSAPLVWPDGTVGTYTATTVSTAFPGSVDAYTVTYGSPATITYTQPAVTRNTSGAVTTRPALVVS